MDVADLESQGRLLPRNGDPDVPIYEYFCPDCSTKFDKLVSLSRAHEQPLCPNCSGGNSQKLLSTFAAVRSSGDGGAPTVSSGGGGCAGCSGGSCASCH
ncbi:MAG: FmdB family zinc ribbon protein [Chloroflexota bacterium]